MMNLGVVVVVAAGNKELMTDPFVSQQIPTAFALEPDFPLIRVGNVDTSGSLAPRSQQGDVYLVGLWTWCARAGYPNVLSQLNGTSVAMGTFAGLVSYFMGLQTVPFAFGDTDIGQYQRIVKDHFVNGEGAWIRPGGVHGQYRVACNLLDGSANTVCRYGIAKRQEQPANICQSSSTSSISPTQTSNTLDEVSLDVYYSLEEPCEEAPSKCGMIFYVYETGADGASLPIHDCGGDLGQGSDSVQFQLFSSREVWINLTYTPSSKSAGMVTGNGLTSPVICSSSTSGRPAWTCSNVKRSEPGSISAPYLAYYKWATCALNTN